MEKIERRKYGESSQMRKIPGTTCVVCDGQRCGVNFGVLSCAACAAFFRRAIVLQKEYQCKQNDDCVIPSNSAKQRFCKHCRLQKCLTVGMQPESASSEVQYPRDKLVNCETISLSPTEDGDRKTSENTNSMNTLKRMMIQYQILKERRSVKYSTEEAASQESPIETTVDRGRFIWQSEPNLLAEYLSACEAFHSVTVIDKTILFTNYQLVSRVIEQAYTTMVNGGVAQNRSYTLDGSYVENSEESMKRYFCNGATTELCSETTKVLARNSLSYLDYNIHSVASAMLALSLDEAELVALLYIALWDQRIDKLSSMGKEIAKRQRNRMFIDLADHYTAKGGDPVVRMGNTLLLLSSVQENAFMLKEFFRQLDITKTKVLSEQLMQQLNFDMS